MPWIAATTGRRERLEGGDHVAQHRWRRRLAKFTDIGARDESSAGTGKNDARNRAVGGDRLDRIKQTLAHRLGQGIHGRIVDGDEDDAVFAGK